MGRGKAQPRTILVHERLEAGLRGKGLLVEAEGDDPTCLRDLERFAAQTPGMRRTDVALARHWLWFANAPKRFVIAVVPPRA